MVIESEQKVLTSMLVRNKEIEALQSKNQNINNDHLNLEFKG